MTVMQDLSHLVNVIAASAKALWNFAPAAVKWVPTIFGWMKRSKEVVDQVAGAVDQVTSIVEPKVSVLDQLTFMIWPRAKLTYWLADEEVVVYVDKFEQKDKFKLQYRESISRKTVLVNSANPLNYRLEQLSSKDPIAPTEIQQDQRYN
jgi:hypothetical protein